MIVGALVGGGGVDRLDHLAVVAERGEQLLVEQPIVRIERSRGIHPEPLARVHQQVKAAQPEPLEHVDLQVMLLVEQASGNTEIAPVCTSNESWT